ncbi:hypothetical protein H4R18_002447 [Coemansia javaensis]|uniref:Ligatin n=1 Tax=Coemansia javaensis TaxID=2761396 RepID=A0A9W8HBX0_9FUNG|nr:hypothetical protein H4R18_002447 [Coemansia javaensis]
MFKKPFQTKPRYSIRASGCRQLAEEARELFPQAWGPVEQAGRAAGGDADADADSPVPGRLLAAKFTSHVGDKGEIIYSEAGNPLWLRAEIRGREGAVLVPTVYTQWRFPGVLPIVWTGAAVVDKLIGGADLMTAGLVVPDEGLGDLKKGALVAVCCPGTQAAQAIGTLAIDVKDIRSVAGAKGKAVLIVHTHRDYLWASGDKTVPGGAGGVAGEEHPADSSGAESDSGNDDHGIGAGGEGEEVCVSPAEMDALLMATLRQIMATVLDAEHASGLLPISSSVLYSGYMVANAPEGPGIDIKKSTYKKLGRFLKAAEKRGLLKLKDIRGEAHVKSFDWGHKDLAEYQPYRVRSAAKGGATKGDTAKSDTAKGGRPEDDSSSTIVVSELVRPPAALVPLFDAAGAAVPPSGYYTRQQARAVLEDYIRVGGLADPSSPRDVRIDGLICDGLLTKDEYSALTTFPRDRLHARLQERMAVHTRVSIPGRAPAVRPGPPACVDIVCERRAGNKVVTRAVGLEGYGIDPAAVARELRTACASSTAVDAVPGKKGAQAALVQGHHVKTVARLLAGYGLPAELLRVTDKSGKAPKKQPTQG